jgi:hypothetical protein
MDADLSASLAVHGERDDIAALSALRQWLSDEPEFRGQIATGGAQLSDSDMGAVVDVLVVAVGSGGALTMLVNSISTWLQQRRSEVEVELTTSTGDVVRIKASGPVASDIAGKIGDTS